MKRVAIIDRISPKFVAWLVMMVYAILCYVIGTYAFNKESDNIVAILYD